LRLLAEKIAKGVAAVSAGVLVSRFLLLLSTVASTRLLGAEGFGEFSSVQLTMATVATVSGLGLGLASTRYIAQYADADPIEAQSITAFVISVTTVVGLVASALCLLFSPTIAVALLGSADLKSLVCAASPLVVLTSLSAVQMGVLFGVGAFSSTAKSYFAQGAATVTAVPAGAVIAGAYGALIGQVIALVISCWVTHRLLKEEMRQRGWAPRFLIEKRHLSLVRDFGGPALIADAAVMFALWGGTIMLLSSPDGFWQAGVFRAANQWYMAALVLPSIVSSVFLPILSERLAQGDRDGSFYVFSRATIAIGVVGIPAALIGVSLAPFAMRISGSDFVAAGPVLSLMIWTALIQATQAPTSSIIQASGRMWLAALMNVAWAAIVISTFFFMSKNAESLSFARLIAYIVQFLWGVAFVTYFFKFGVFANSNRPSADE
jgi:O-antigen/teichoic acid export membrane protein